MFIYDDNFLTENEMQNIEDAFFSKEISWTYFPFTSASPDSKKPNIKNLNTVDIGVQDLPYFSSSILQNIVGYENLQHEKAQIFIDLINKMFNKHQIDFDYISRIKLNINPWNDKTYSLFPHVDDFSKHYIFLYYINDSDGDTIIYDQTTDNKDITKESLTIMQKITPKRGSAFIADGKHFHAATPPNVNSLRCVINANIMFTNYQ